MRCQRCRRLFGSMFIRRNGLCIYCCESERPSGDKNGDKPSESTTEPVTAESENTEKPGDF